MPIHADDFGITLHQAAELHALAAGCRDDGALESVSIFAVSPAFHGAAALIKPAVDAGALQIALHLDVVEGRPCLPAQDVPLLTGPRGTFSRDFTSLLALSLGPHRQQLKQQLAREFSAQIACFLQEFPSQRACLRLDSHQHVHAIPLAFDALLDAVEVTGCTLAHLRLPDEPLAPYRAAGRLRSITPVNAAKGALLHALCARDRAKLPAGCATSLFCGVLLSGCMDTLDAALLAAFQAEAQRRNLPLEVLFHPVSVPIEQCLDPGNKPFASACASPSRDAEARTVRALAHVASGTR